MHLIFFLIALHIQVINKIRIALSTLQIQHRACLNYAIVLKNERIVLKCSTESSKQARQLTEY
jgi:hypothetical protein